MTLLTRSTNDGRYDPSVTIETFTKYYHGPVEFTQGFDLRNVSRISKVNIGLVNQIREGHEGKDMGTSTGRNTPETCVTSMDVLAQCNIPHLSSFQSNRQVKAW